MIDAYADREAREKRERDHAKREAAQFRADMQAVMALPEARRVVGAFLGDMGVDRLAYRQTQHDMVIAAAMQDCARWWTTAIREHCPEREAQMRAEARKAAQTAREGTSEEDENAG